MASSRELRASMSFTPPSSPSLQGLPALSGTYRSGCGAAHNRHSRRAIKQSNTALFAILELLRDGTAVLRDVCSGSCVHMETVARGKWQETGAQKHGQRRVITVALTSYHTRTRAMGGGPSEKDLPLRQEMEFVVVEGERDQSVVDELRLSDVQITTGMNASDNFCSKAGTRFCRPTEELQPPTEPVGTDTAPKATDTAPTAATGKSGKTKTTTGSTTVAVGESPRAINLYKAGPPDCGELVWARVSEQNTCDPKGYLDTDSSCVLVDLLEYGDLVGVIDPEFISLHRKKKTASTLRGLKVGKCFAAVVLQVDVKDDGRVFIDLSKRDVSPAQKTQAQLRYDKAVKLFRLLNKAATAASHPRTTTGGALLARVSHHLHSKKLPHDDYPYDHLCRQVRSFPFAHRYVRDLCADQGSAECLMDMLIAGSQSGNAGTTPRPCAGHTESKTAMAATLLTAHRLSQDDDTRLPPQVWEEIIWALVDGAADDTDAEESVVWEDNTEAFLSDVSELIWDGMCRMNDFADADVLHFIKIQLLQLTRNYPDRTSSDVASAATCCLLDCACRSTGPPSSSTGAPRVAPTPSQLIPRIRSVIHTWAPVLRQLLDKELVTLHSSYGPAPKGQIELLMGLSEHVHGLTAPDHGDEQQQRQHSVLSQVLLQVLVILYEEEMEDGDELVSREAMLQWWAYSSQQARTQDDDPSMRCMLERARGFIEWLAEDEDEDDADDDDDDDESGDELWRRTGHPIRASDQHHQT